jgi:peptidoglycan/xylan/chitin deacetylase (PgdA/CDA1 family)
MTLEIKITRRVELMGGATAGGADPIGLILMYHRVAELRSDPWRLAVSPSHFAEHLEVLRECGQMLLLARAVKEMRDGGLRPRAIVMTFDDGYADNLQNALPQLEQYEVPATFFVTTGYIGSGREFWWDALEQIIMGPELLPSEIRLTVGACAVEWRLAEARYYPDRERQMDRDWFTTRQDTPSKRYELYRAIHRLLQPLDEPERQRVLNVLSKWAEVEMAERECRRCLSRDEAAALARGNLVELGAHSVTHPILPSLRESSQRDEIRHSKLQLEELIGRPVTSFAYPYGQFASDTALIAMEEGYACACSTRAGVLSQHSELFCLPRMKIEDWDGEVVRQKALPLVQGLMERWP